MGECDDLDLLLLILLNQHEDHVNRSPTFCSPAPFSLNLLTWTSSDAVLSLNSSASATSRSPVQPPPAFKAFPTKTTRRLLSRIDEVCFCLVWDLTDKISLLQRVLLVHEIECRMFCRTEFSYLLVNLESFAKKNNNIPSFLSTIIHLTLIILTDSKSMSGRCGCRFVMISPQIFASFCKF